MNTNSKFEELDFHELDNVNGGSGTVALILKVVGTIASANAVYNVGEGIIDGYKSTRKTYSQGSESYGVGASF